MIIALLNNNTGLIHGDDPKRISCEKSGTLFIGKTSLDLSSKENDIMPLLFHGATGMYAARYTASDGTEYDLGKVEVQNGRISSPPPIALEILSLKSRADIAEAEAVILRQEVEALKNIFDTNSLNFLIKGEEE